MRVSRYILLRMRNFLDKFVKKIETRVLSSVTFFFKSCRLWDNVEKCGGALGAINDVTIRRIRATCWISKAAWTHAQAHANAPGHTHARTHTKCITFIAFPRQQCFRKRASLLRYTYIVCIVKTSKQQLPAWKVPVIANSKVMKFWFVTPCSL